MIIGSGFGGLAAAVRLGARGYRTTVLEPEVSLLRYHRAKTAALFAAATMSGALCSGHDDPGWAAFGQALGEASATSPFVLVTRRVDTKRDTERRFADERAAHAVWLETIRNREHTYAALVRPEAPVRDRCLCEWTSAMGFFDRTDAHYDAIRVLLTELNKGTGATSTLLATPGVPSAIVLDGAIRFCGPTGTHSLGAVAANTEERVRAHWDGFVPPPAPRESSGAETSAPTRGAL